MVETHLSRATLQDARDGSASAHVPSVGSPCLPGAGKSPESQLPIPVNGIKSVLRN